VRKVTSDDVPLTVLIPEVPGQPITLFDTVSALKMAVVERADARRMSSEWDAPGVYVLLDPVAPDGTWGCYVGKAPAGIRGRLAAHVSSKDHWRRALVAVRDTSHGFDSTQSAWLEGRLHDALFSAEYAVMHNKQQPGDSTVRPFERPVLDTCATAILRALRVLGYDAAAAGEAEETPRASSGPRAHHGVPLADLLAAGFVQAGETIASVRLAWPASAVIDSSGLVVFNETVYPSLSAAAAVAKGAVTNGWEFWGVHRDGQLVPLASVRAEYKAGL
jgi:hypothetical protein